MRRRNCWATCFSPCSADTGDSRSPALPAPYRQNRKRRQRTFPESQCFSWASSFLCWGTSPQCSKPNKEYFSFPSSLLFLYGGFAMTFGAAIYSPSAGIRFNGLMISWLLLLHHGVHFSNCPIMWFITRLMTLPSALAVLSLMLISICQCAKSEDGKRHSALKV